MTASPPLKHPSYILTARLDAASFEWLDGLRRAHFPPARNWLAAHLTMFHRLSPEQAERLRAAPRPLQPIALQFDKVVPLGFGNAVRVHSPDLVQLRAALKAAIGDGLSRQDDARWMPHVTVQNKATPEAAQALHGELARDFRIRTGSVDALQLWEYHGGPWRPALLLPFAPDQENAVPRN